jgi:hypothetical protein
VCCYTYSGVDRREQNKVARKQSNNHSNYDRSSNNQICTEDIKKSPGSSQVGFYFLLTMTIIVYDVDLVTYNDDNLSCNPPCPMVNCGLDTWTCQMLMYEIF